MGHVILEIMGNLFIGVKQAVYSKEYMCITPQVLREAAQYHPMLRVKANETTSS